MLRSLRRFPIIFRNRRLLSTLSNSLNNEKKYVLYKLNRSVLGLSGVDSQSFLQGLVTNDVNQLSELPSIFSYFLDVRGRVLFDTILYRTDGEILIECDTSTVSKLQKHLMTYKLRKKVVIRELNTKVWALFDADNALPIEKPYFDGISTVDPRLPNLGFRLLSPDTPNLESLTCESDSLYRRFRYKLGISEGAEETPPGECIPFDLSGDLLNGISFQKGCYIGQELTARAHFTGVIRKRLMPIYFPKITVNVSVGTSVEDPKSTRKIPVGKLRALSGDVGIALMKVNEALAAGTLKVGPYSVTTCKPSWWPS